MKPKFEVKILISLGKNKDPQKYLQHNITNVFKLETIVDELVITFTNYDHKEETYYFKLDEIMKLKMKRIIDLKMEKV